MDEARMELEAARTAFEEERRAMKQDLLVQQMRAEQGTAQLQRDRDALERDRKKLQDENALLAVRAGRVG